MPAYKTTYQGLRFHVSMVCWSTNELKASLGYIVKFLLEKPFDFRAVSAFGSSAWSTKLQVCCSSFGSRQTKRSWVITLNAPSGLTSSPLISFSIYVQNEVKIALLTITSTWIVTFGQHLWTRFMSESPDVLQRQSVKETVRNRHILGSMIHPPLAATAD